MKESERRPAFRESPQQRRRLDELNRLLAGVEAGLEAEPASPAWPLVFVIGAPRSGTTLVSQVLASSGGYAWVNNFVARFWEAPVLGAKLARAMGLDAEAFGSSFDSAWGTTRGWLEPHEFGYFWNRFFDLGQETHALSPAELERVDAAGLRRAIDRLQVELGGPLMLKNNTWCSFQAAFLAELFPRAIFVACFRGVAWLAQSFLLARRARLEDPHGWWSVRPPSYDTLRRLPVPQQVVGQAHDIQAGIERALRAVAPERVVRVEYAELCRAPRDVCRRTAAAAGLAAGDLARVPSAFESRDVVRVPPDEWQILSQLASLQAGAPS